MPTATQVAEWIVRVRHDDLAAPVDPMSLEKLTYYAQCFRLALTGQPLFQDPIRAWRYGPVVRAVWDNYHEHGAQPIIPTPGQVPVFARDIDVFLRDLINFFGNYNAVQLSNATHSEDPWIEARHGYGRYENSDVAMPIDRLRTYYCSLVSDGEDALSRHELLDVVPEPRWASLYVAGISYRRMFSHPFYRPALAKELLHPIPNDTENVSDDFYAPITNHEMVEFPDGENIEEIIKRATAAA